MKIPKKIKIFKMNWSITVSSKLGSIAEFPERKIIVEKFKNEEVTLECLRHEIAEAVFIEMGTSYASSGYEVKPIYVLTHKEMSFFIQEFASIINKLKRL